MRRYLVSFLIMISLLLIGIPLLVIWQSPGQLLTGDSKQELEIKLLDKKEGKEHILSLEKYLVGVVAAEMPANFEPEALKAQAIAARTYAVRRMFRFGGVNCEEHQNAEICSNPAHCQAWNNESELKSKWGMLKYYFYLEKIKAALKQTEGLVIMYNGALIDPVYHGSCGGIGTENSEDVWSGQIPYLRGVSCDTEYRASEQIHIVDVKKDSLVSALGSAGIDVPVTAQLGSSVIKPIKKSSKGRIMEAELFGQKITGMNLRSVLGLTSTYINWEISDRKIKFESVGKGHAVGMCQYGANGMALAGRTYEDIISHYYSGIKIKKLKY